MVDRSVLQLQAHSNQVLFLILVNQLGIMYCVTKDSTLCPGVLYPIVL